jgi:4-amino-4-deoxy-L-arabinose transferase-like glycosyltransferase
VTEPTPAIVAQSAVRRLPRLALLLFCAAYVIPGFVGREPWKNADMTALGYMFELTQPNADWLDPRLLGQPPEFDALLPYWLGAWAMQLAPAWMPADFAARLPFVALLVVTLLATWYGVYYLARSPGAQPVPFAFGGEAQPTDYARAMADAGLLALIACFGLAQLSHETTPSLAQLGCTAVAFYGLAALPYRRFAGLAVAAGLAGLALSGAPAMALLYALGGLVVTWWMPPATDRAADSRAGQLAIIAASAVLAAGLAWVLQTWHWRIGFTAGPGRELRLVLRLVLWFTWPLWPLAVWTLWRWRRQLRQPHVALPAWFAGVALVATLITPSSDRALLLGLPALATLAAFALPTLKRSVSSLIDWFTLLFFSGCAIVIWVIWLSMQTGVPAKPAANIAKLAPGFEPSFSWLPLLVALAATLAWVWLVRWRTARHRDAIWKSLVLPAGGAALGWLLVMTLWLPVLDYARSYVPVVNGLTRLIQPAGCVEVFGLNRGQLAALRYHGGLELKEATTEGVCPWLVATQDMQSSLGMAFDAERWSLVAAVRRPTDARDNLLLYRRTGR